MENWIVAGIKILWDFIKVHLNKVKAADRLYESREIREIAKGIVEKGLSIDCFLLMQVHNGSGRLLPHSFQYWSVIEGYHDSLAMPRFRMEGYRRIVMDPDYLNLFLKIYEAKEHWIDYSTIPPGTMQTHWEFENVRFAKFFFIKQNSSAMWFLVACTSAYNETLSTTKHRFELNLAVNKIKNIIRKY